MGIAHVDKAQCLPYIKYLVNDSYYYSENSDNLFNSQ